MSNFLKVQIKTAIYEMTQKIRSASVDIFNKFFNYRQSGTNHNNMMINFQKTFSTVRNVLIASAVIFSMSRCQDKELQSVAQEANTEMAASALTGSNIESLTISGSNTHFNTAVDCKTCTYIVAAGTEVIDGKNLGLKAGSVICLNKAIKYGNLSFLNLEGTDKDPIIIGSSVIASN